MKIKRYGLALAVGLLSISYAYAAGLWPDYPVVGGASYCAGSSQSAVGSIIGSVTGCPNTVPAGPSILTGNEQIPADTRLSSGAQPQTVLIPMASLNALPIVFSNANSPTAANTLSATNTQGGIYLVGAGNLSKLNVTLPSSPIDGQQFVVDSNQSIQTLAVDSPSGTSVSNTPTALTKSTTAAYGFRFVFNAASSTWFRLQ